MTYLQLMEALIERGADPNARLGKKLWFRPSDHDDVWVGTAGTTAFWRAAFANDVDAMRVLARRGANPNLASNEAKHALNGRGRTRVEGKPSKTVAGSRLAAVKLCLELGADLKATDEFKYTALHGAAYRGDNELVKFLVEGRAAGCENDFRYQCHRHGQWVRGLQQPSARAPRNRPAAVGARCADTVTPDLEKARTATPKL